MIRQNSKEKTELLSRAKQDSELAMLLHLKSLEDKKYNAARFFAKLIIDQQPDSFQGHHAVYSSFALQGDYLSALDYLESLPDRFKNLPTYVDGKLLCLVKLSRMAKAAHFLDDSHGYADKNSYVYLTQAAIIWNHENDIGRMLACQEKLWEVYKDRNAAVLLGLHFLNDEQNYLRSAQLLKTVIDENCDDSMHYTAKSLYPVALMKLRDSSWKASAETAAKELDAVADASFIRFWCRRLSVPLWKLLGEEQNADDNEEFVSEIEKFAENPTKYIDMCKKEAANSNLKEM